MGLLDRVREEVEARTGLAIRPRELVDRLQESSVELQQFRAEASELAYHALDYFSGRPQEMEPEARKRLAQRSRIAFLQDPLAGAEALLLANFAFGRGVGQPTAQDDLVQEVIDRAWSDPNNVEKLTGFAAQRRSSNSLLTQGELFDLLYAKGGRIRVGKLDPDTINDIVPDPEDRLRPIYYVGRRRTYKWDVQRDAPDITDELGEEGRPKVTYYPHWRNLEDAEQEREGREGLEALPSIPTEKQDPGGGVVYHTAINQVDEQLRGNPPWARTLRFYSAMNQFTESRVSMAQAASTFIAKRVHQGGPKDIVKAAGSILSQTGELGTQRFTDDIGGLGPTGLAPQGDPRAMPPAPGSWWVENQQSKLESLSLNSGAAGAAQDSQIIRAPLAAASSFGQHYLGDAGNANLATATSLELPTLMNVQAWQEIFEQRFRWFIDRAIEEAARAGELGGAYEEGEDGRKLAEMRLQETDDHAEFEKRTGRDLSYSFSMPYPGRRNLPDVTATFTGVLGASGLGENPIMVEKALTFLFTHGWEIEDPAQAAEEVMEEHKKLLEERKEMAKKQLDASLADPNAPPGSQPGTPGMPDQPAGALAPKQEMGVTEREWLPVEFRDPVARFSAQTEETFDELVTGPAILAAAKLTPPVPEVVVANGR